MAAVDFTSSNGDINDARSLHYIKGTLPNAYQQCIRAVKSILCPHTEDGRVFVRGFGREINGDPDDCFPSSKNHSSSDATGCSVHPPHPTQRTEQPRPDSPVGDGFIQATANRQ
jgi:hypothetical protein